MTPTERADRRYLFVDLNSFFASCEQADNPALRGEPVIVVPGPGSCALAASYEAKAFGIKTGTPEKEARFLCPRVRVVRARPKRYMEYHFAFAAILESLAPNVEMRSVDEAAIRLCRNEDPWQLGWQIKRRLWTDLSPALNCSVGLGPNSFLAKLATELEKPNGMSEIRLTDLPTVYQKVALRDLCGINYRMERRLQALGIYTPSAFYAAEAERLRRHFGVIGSRWWLNLHGYPSYQVATVRRTLSHSHVLPPALRQPEAAYVTLQRLVAKVGRRLRREGYLARRLAVYIRYLDRQSEADELKISPAADSLTLIAVSQQIWQRLAPRQPIVQLAVWAGDLVMDQGVPLSLFESDRRQQRLSQALDKINDRHGADTIRFAVTDQPGSRAPDRISFNSLFKIEHE